MNQKGKLLSYALAFVLCYSQLVASAHFVEHLPQQGQDKSELISHAAMHEAEQEELPATAHRAVHKSNRLAQHASLHANHSEHATSPVAAFAPTASEHGERANAECSIYHFYSGLNGLIQAKTDTPCAYFDHIVSVSARATAHQQAFVHHQPIRAPPFPIS